MKSELQSHDGIDYLKFKFASMHHCLMLPVITKGSRDKANAWTWNGSIDKPTLRPSIKVQYTNEKGKQYIIHGWLNDGVFQSLSDSTDGTANTNVELVKL